MSSIRKAPGGRRGWQVRYRDPTGVERTKSFTAKADARAFLSANDEEVRRGEWIDPAGAQRTFGDWYAEWVQTTVNLRPSTRARDDSYARTHILPAFGNAPLGRITHVAVQAWVARLTASGLAPATVTKAEQILSKALASAVDARLIAHNPASRVRLPRIERKEMRFTDPDGLGALAEAIRPQYRALVLLGGYGGLRAGELCGLRRERVDVLGARLVVEEVLVEVQGHHHFGPPKTSAGRRTVPLPRFVTEQLAEHLERQAVPPGGLVFTAPEGGPVRLSQFRRRYWLPAVAAAGLDGLRIHDLRHTAVSLWIAAGATPLEIARWAGHTSTWVVLDRYGHLLPGLEDRVTGRLDEMARAAKTPDLAVVRELHGR
jgi:integrase